MCVFVETKRSNGKNYNRASNINNFYSCTPFHEIGVKSSTIVLCTCSFLHNSVKFSGENINKMKRNFCHRTDIRSIPTFEDF